MQKIIEDLYKLPRYLLGEGIDKSLEYINNIIPLEIYEFPTGTKVYDWTIPEEWSIKDGWVKFNGKKILDYKENPLCIGVGSVSVNEKMDLETFKQHLITSEEQPDAYPYEYHLYDKTWSVTMPKNMAYKKVEPDVEGFDKWELTLEEGEYEVFIDSEHKEGVMKVGVHTIPGKSEKEILLFAHLDHPWQANDNLSSVAALIDMADKFNTEHTIKLIFAPETIGSIAYIKKMDTSNVDFVIALECIGNNNSVLFQKSYQGNSRIDDCAWLALQSKGTDYRAGQFRYLIGSDEYAFNDPKIGIPGIMLSRWDYPEYHTSNDTPDKININKIKEVQDIILKTIEIYEKDFIPTRKIIGPLFRSKYGIQTPHKLMNLNLDYLWYDIDGKKYLSDIISRMGMSFDYAYDVLSRIK